MPVLKHLMLNHMVFDFMGPFTSNESGNEIKKSQTTSKQDRRTRMHSNRNGDTPVDKQIPLKIINDKHQKKCFAFAWC